MPLMSVYHKTPRIHHSRLNNLKTNAMDVWLPFNPSHTPLNNKGPQNYNVIYSDVCLTTYSITPLHTPLINKQLQKCSKQNDKRRSAGSSCKKNPFL